MATANEEWRDRLIAHQISLLRLSGPINNKIVQLLDVTEADMRDKIERALSRLVRPGVGSDFSDITLKRRLRVLLEEIKGLRGAAMSGVLDEWTAQMRDIALMEPKFSQANLYAVAPVIFDVALPAPALLRSLVSSKPFEGRTLREWARALQSADLERISNEIRIGMVQGEDVRQIARRIVGTAQLNGTDGTTEITRRGAIAITRTAVNFFSNEARQEFFRENSDIFTEELYVATLDSRTTAICRSLDGKTFPVGEGPRPPQHFQCRSLRVAVITDEPIGSRPFNPTSERQLLREFAQREGIKPVTSRDSLPFGTKGAFDTFARNRVKELIGRVPAKTTYEQFLKKQSAEFQDEVLGRTRARLFRTGKMPLGRFVDNRGSELTLTQLAIKYQNEFIAAGIDPETLL